MNLQIKEELKRICIRKGWTYAVFWRLNCSLLMPEDAYYEPWRHSVVSDCFVPAKNDREGFQNPSRNGCSIQTNDEAEEQSASLIEKIHKVHLAGEGIIGRVASSGKHRWIFHDTYYGEQSRLGPCDYQSAFQDTADLQHQFSAGIKTIAIISVAFHGVIQIGSTQKIIENLELVEDIRSSFLHLAIVPGPFLSGNTKGSFNYTIPCSASCGTSASVVSSGNFYSEPSVIKSLDDDPCKDQTFKTQISAILTQPSSSSTSWSHQSSMQSHDPAVPCITKYSNDLLKKMAPYTSNSSFHLTNRCRTAGTEAQVILSKPKLGYTQVLSQSNSNSANWNQLLVASSRLNKSLSGDFSTLALMEQQLLSEMENQGFPNISPSNAPTVAPCGTTFHKYQGDSMLNPLFGTNESLDTKTNPMSLDIYSDIVFGTRKPVDIKPSCSPHLVAGGEQSAGKSSSRTAPFVLDTNFDTFLGEFIPGYAGSEFSKPDPVNNQNPWTAAPSEPVNNGHLDSLHNELLQALSIAFPSSGLVGADGPTWSGGISENDPRNFIQDSLSSSLSSIKENQRIVGAVCNGKQKSWDSPMQMHRVDGLFDSLESASRDNHQQACWDDIMATVASVNCSNLGSGISELDADSMAGLEKGYFSEIGSEHLLDAVVSNFSTVSNKNSDDLLSKSTLTRASSGSLYSSPSQLVGLSYVGENVDNFLPGNGEKTALRSQKEVLSRSQISSWVEQSHGINASSTVIGQPSRVKEALKVTRKRARPGESTRPRPKDRQQIQDRVKELREIVPNGAKCSIDSLLERTIKHMRFLQSVTKHADKLKQAGEPKIIGKDSNLALKDTLGGGGCATLAFEVGRQSTVCPIIVEDLSPPGQMLVEMLCEERGFFLEIADIIRGFGVTILKGVMEVHDDKIWARFVVEANREVTRLDIFLSLVQLLEQTSKNGTSPCNQPTKVIDSRGPVFTSYQQSSMPLPIGLAERLQ